MSVQSFRGRRVWRGGSNSRSSQGPIRPAPAPPLGSILKEFTPDEFSTDEQEIQNKNTITECEFLASFNWLDAKKPSIVFPGMPALWNPPLETRRLRHDSGEYFHDANAARHPKHPMEPAVQAVLASRPDFDTASVDIFACTSTLGNLSRFLRKDGKPFRFTVEAVGRTVFFVRRENAPDERIAGPKGFGPAGFGHTFPERYTQWQKGMEGSDSHQRVISYKFAGLKCLVRFEADGFLEEELMKGEEETSEGEETLIGGRKPGVTRVGTLAIDNINIRSAGRLVPQHAVFDLKTRSAYKKDKDQMADHLPRLWQAQIPFFIVAFHSNGQFAPEDIIVKDTRSDVARWQDDNQELLDRFGSLLTKLTSLARDPDFGKYEVCSSEPGILQIRTQGGTVFSPLPSSLIWIRADEDGLSKNSGSDEVSLGAEKAAYSDDDDFVEDYTACSVNCGYCGRCRYKL